MTAPIVTIADEVKDLVASMSLSQTITPERVYLRDARIQTIGADICVWVQPSSVEIENHSRLNDKVTYTVDVGIFRKCVTDAEVDAMITLAEEIRSGFNRNEFSNGSRTMFAEMEVLFSQEYLVEKNLFATAISVTVVDLISATE